MRHTARNAQGSQLGMRPSAEFCMISFYLQPLADGIRYKLGGLSPLKSAISVIEELSCYHMTIDRIQIYIEGDGGMHSKLFDV